jgi:hypothetical protein
MTLYWLYLNFSKIIQGKCIYTHKISAEFIAGYCMWTSTSTTETVSRRRSTRPIGCLLSLSTSMVTSSQVQIYVCTRFVHRHIPGTGHIRDTGAGKKGKHHSINVPLQDGMDDSSYEFIFKPVMNKVTKACIHVCCTCYFV